LLNYGTIVKLDTLADTTWIQRIPTSLIGTNPKAIVETADGGFTLCSSERDSTSAGRGVDRTVISHVDSIGTLIWSRIYDAGSEFISPHDMIRMHNGNYAVVGMDVDSMGPPYSLYASLAIYDSLGNRIQNFRFSGNADGNRGEFHEIMQTADNGLLIAGGSLTPIDSLFLVKLDAQYDLQWEKKFRPSPYNIDLDVMTLARNSVGGYYMGVMNWSVGFPGLVVVDSTGTLKTNTVSGNIFLDTSLDCVQDSLEIGLQQLMVRFKQGQSGFEYFALTDSNGHYEVALPYGAYQVEMATPSVYYDLNCLPPDTLFLTTYDQDTVDFPLTITDYCTYNSVSVSAPFIRFNGLSPITVKACNYGTIDSYPTRVEVELDSALSFVSSNIPTSQIMGQTLIFDLDTLAANECVDIYIQTQLDTLTLPGATHCIEAQIYPDTVCVIPTWAGARIIASASCEDDSITFTLTNKGMDMIAAQTTTVYIDDVIFKTAPFQLDNQESVSFVELADSGATYLIQAPQEPGYPFYLGDSTVIAFEEGCVPYADGTYNTGFITQYYLGNIAPSKAILCQENIAAYDPNDKLALPKGYGEPHYIEPETPIQYTIRFQNTGNDTARRVILLDTLSEYLDLATLELGASSHPYSAKIVGERTLRFLFQPIVLVDSNTNELASIGQVSFRISPKQDVPLETVIPNRAGIYFDFAAPVMTPEIFHTIGEDFIPLRVISHTDPLTESLGLKVWPNPFEEEVHFYLAQPARELEVRIMDMQGRMILREKVQHTQEINVSTSDVPRGMYLYQVIQNGQSIGQGKLLK
ncbi:MAG: T9SS type A sorting domain-containing protein, partial [Bacteroidota bacterium]